MARPQVEIDWEEFDKLMFFGASLRECSWWFGCSERTIERAVLREKKVGFDDYRAQKEIRCKMGIKRKIIQRALAGDNTMLIWTSKNILGWSDRSDSQAKVVINRDITFSASFGDGDEPDKAG